MFWKKKQNTVDQKPEDSSAKTAKPVKLPGPKPVPELVKKQIVNQFKKDYSLLGDILAVTCKSSEQENSCNIRVYSDIDAKVRSIEVHDYTTLDIHPELIYFDGLFNQKQKRVELVERRELKPLPKTKIFTEAEIKKQIEDLKQPGDEAVFFLAGSPNYGGPLGRGAAVVEINPNYPNKGSKKYVLYTSNVDGLQPVGKKQKLLESDKAKPVANWIKEAHHEPHY